MVGPNKVCFETQAIYTQRKSISKNGTAHIFLNNMFMERDLKNIYANVNKNKRVVINAKILKTDYLIILCGNGPI